MKKINIGVLCTLLLTVHTTQAAIALDRTRAIYNGQNKSISLNIRNENKELPYLAQAWIENEQWVKITTPLVVIPPVQRIEPGAKSMVRINAMPNIITLPQDRESLFYFNLREIPPKSDKQNVMQIALQTKIKLFYRPEGITPESGVIWQEQLILHKMPQGYRVENPTPYYVTIADIAGQKSAKPSANFTAMMVAPKSSTELKSLSYPSPVLTYIDDYGGRSTLKFNCSGSICRTVTAS